jgi:hypothetical protein
VKHTETSTGQKEMLQSLHDMGPDELSSFLQEQRQRAEEALVRIAPAAPTSIPYEKLWPQVLTRHVVRLPDVNKIAVQMRQTKRLLFLDWEKGKRVPQPHYRVQRDGEI